MLARNRVGRLFERVHVCHAREHSDQRRDKDWHQRESSRAVRDQLLVRSLHAFHGARSAFDRIMGDRARRIKLTSLLLRTAAHGD